MSKTIQLRDVPDALHRRLRAKAALEGLSLSDFLIREMQGIASRPTIAEMRRRLALLPAITLKTSPAEIIREVRDR